MPIPAQMRHSGRQARRAAKAIARTARAQAGPATSGHTAALGTP
jgi:hypothetical protein